MYFRNIPDIQYDTKPVQYPFSQSDFVRTKNFFRRYQINPDVFSYSVYFKKYALQDGDRLDVLAEKLYGDPFMDWVLVLTNNMINPLFGFPLSENDLRKHIESSYDNPYSEIHHYESIELKNNQGALVLKGGLIVDEKFYSSTFKYWNGSNVSQVIGSEVSFPVSVYDYEVMENEKKREIYLLKPQYIDAFINDFKKTNLYTKSSDYISNDLKKTGV
jgi:hypothetical protein